MSFGIPNIECEVEANKERVITNIMTLQGLRSVNSNVLLKYGDTFGSSILDDLPDDVRVFTYSDGLPDITANRDGGTEIWNAEQALNWALADQPGNVKECILESVGEIL